MLRIKIYNQEGKIAGEESLDPKIFDVPVNESVVHQVVVGLQANMRPVVAHTKTKGEVRGGGRKPWKQKGTGRARHGSIRSPLWKGGGVTFGPRNEVVYKQKINKKMKQKAYFMCLSEKVRENTMIVLDKIELKEAKTKKMIEMLKKFPVGKSTLIALPSKDEKIIKSGKNINWLKIDLIGNLNVLDIIKSKYLILPMESIKKLEEIYIKKA